MIEFTCNLYSYYIRFINKSKNNNNKKLYDQTFFIEQPIIKWEKKINL